jgi:hypothetical protein
MKKKEDINDYCSAADAAQILSEKLGRPIANNYISRMTKSGRRSIRVVKFGNRWMYHRGDIAACTIRQKHSA